MMGFRSFIVFIFFGINFGCFAQTSNTIISIQPDELYDLDYDDLFKNNNNLIQVFQYNLNKKRKFILDSLLVSKIEIDTDSNKIFGKSYISTHQSLGKTYLTSFNFQYYYNYDGQLIKYIFEPETTEKDYMEYMPITIKKVTINEYYGQNKLSKKTINNYQKHLKTNQKDTLWVTTLDTKIEEFLYNENGFKVSNYITVDSTRDLTKSSFYSNREYVTCKNCQERCLTQKSKYNGNGKIKEHFLYYSDNKMYFKNYYNYDENNNLINKIDSILIDYQSNTFNWFLTTIFEYSDTEHIEIKNYNQNLKFYHLPQKNIIIRNSLNQIKSEYNKDADGKSSNKYFYYENHKTKSIVSIDNKNRKLTTTFLYNKQGQLIEKKEMRKKKIIDLIRYYYD